MDCDPLANPPKFPFRLWIDGLLRDATKRDFRPLGQKPQQVVRPDAVSPIRRERHSVGEEEDLLQRDSAIDSLP